MPLSLAVAPFGRAAPLYQGCSELRRHKPAGDPSASDTRL